MNFGTIIIRWYKKNKRELPWRDTRNPYLIWLSEIILQQTRVEQGLSYYLRFAEKYPNVKSLANAKEDDVLKLWQGLGYYSRARNLYKAAKKIVAEFSGKFPTEYHNIKSLNGVGDYTAAAISSFAFDQKYPVVDGNVYRVLSRYFGIETPIDSTSGKKEFTNLAGELMNEFPPAIYNQAIMEFGARQCCPSNPDCERCPLNSTCFSFKYKTVLLFPIKKNKTKTKKRYFNYLVIKNNNNFFIKKRNDKDIWQGLYDFPLIETNERITETKLLCSDEWEKTFKGQKIKLHSTSTEFKHILSHQHIHAKFYEILTDITFFNEAKPEWKRVDSKSVKSFAVPRLIDIYLENNASSNRMVQKSKKRHSNKLY